MSDYEQLLERVQQLRKEAAMLKHPPGTGWTDYFSALDATLDDVERLIDSMIDASLEAKWRD